MFFPSVCPLLKLIHDWLHSRDFVTYLIKDRNMLCSEATGSHRPGERLLGLTLKVLAGAFLDRSFLFFLVGHTLDLSSFAEFIFDSREDFHNGLRGARNSADC